MSFNPDKSDAQNLEQILQMGITAAKEGNAQGARIYFERVINQSPSDGRVWLWMASIATDEIERRRCLETVLKLDPNNEMARRYLTNIENRRSTGEGQTLRIGLIILAILVIVLVIGFAVVFIVSRR